MKSCEKLNAILKQRYDLDLMIEPINHDHIASVFEHYSDQRRIYRDSLLETADQHSKAFLISEAARLILREIAPKRRKKKKGVS